MKIVELQIFSLLLSAVWLGSRFLSHGSLSQNNEKGRSLVVCRQTPRQDIARKIETGDRRLTCMTAVR